MYGFEEFYKELIEEAKSPEEVKKILEHGFPNVPNDIINAIVDLDPTKKKSYSRWAVMMYEKEGDLLAKSISNGTLKKIFKYFQERNNTGLNLSDIKTLKEAIEYLPEFDPILTKNGDGGPEDDYDIVYDTPEWKIVVPHTYEASVKLGKGCRWCTAGAFGDGESFYKTYSSYGPLWINFDFRKGETCPMDNKEYPYTRYQFLFEYRNFYGELMDSNDERISFKNIDIPEEVVEFYTSKNKKYGDTINEKEYTEEDWNNYYEMRYEQGIVLKNIYDTQKELVLLEEINRDTPELQNPGFYYLYDTDDVDDPITSVRFNSECVVDGFGESPCILLKSTENEYFFAYLASNESYWSCDYINNPKILKEDGLLFVWDYWGEDKVSDLLQSFELYFYDDKSYSNYVDELVVRHPIENVIVNSLNKNGFDLIDCSFEIIFNNGFHALYSVDEDEWIVRYDKPIAKVFQISSKKDKNGNDILYIQGLHGIHYLNLYSEEDEEGNRTYDFFKQINDYAFIVETKFGPNERYNIFDKTMNKLIFKEWYRYYDYNFDDKNVVMFVSDKSNKVGADKRIIYSFPNRAVFVFDYVIFNDKLVIGNNYKWNGYKNEITSSTLLNKEGEKIKEFEKATSLLLGDKVLTEYSLNDGTGISGKKIYDVKTDSFDLPDGIKLVYSANGEPMDSDDNKKYREEYIIYFDEQASENVFYNYITKEIIITNFNYRPKKFVFNDDTICYRFKTRENKFNAIVNDKKIFPSYVEDILCNYVVQGYFPFINEKKLYFYNYITGEIKPKNGLNTNYLNIRGDSLFTTENVFVLYVDTNMITDNFENIDDASFTFNPVTNEIKAKNDVVKETIYNYILNDSMQISESFKKILDRISNIKF